MKRIPKEIKIQLFRFLNEEMSTEELEQWVYQNRDLEVVFNREDYLELISLNYESSQTRHDLEKILTKYVRTGEYESWKIKKLLMKVLNKKENLPYTLPEIYFLYCRGFYFLDNLALGFGIEVQSRLDEGVSRDSIEIHDLIESFLPNIHQEAEKVLSWLVEGKIIIRDEYDDLGDIQFIDNRLENEKVPTAYIKAKN
jgi:hypothetical protein